MAVGQNVAGTLFGVIIVAAIIGIPISVALVRNHRYSEATKHSHMWGWVPGNPDIGRTHEFTEAPPSPYGTAGPRVVHEERTGFGKRAWILAGEPPPRESVTEPAPIEATDAPSVILAERRKFETVDAIEDFSESFADSANMAEPSVPEIRVLGRVEVVGWLEKPDRRIIPELACFLALHSDRRVPGEEIRAALWPGDLETTEASMKSLHNAVSNLRRCLGAEYVSQASKGSGYQLSEKVRTDWSFFSDFVERASRHDVDEIDLLTSALALVRGAPFEGVVPGSYTWAWTEFFVTRIEVAIAHAAARLSSLHLDHSEPDKARWAALKGLSASPYDRALWTNFLTAAATGGPGELDRAAKHLASVLGDDARDLDKLIAELRRPS